MLDRYAWVVFLVAVVANAVLLKFRSVPLIRQHPELAGGYRSLFYSFLIWGGTPWLVMGAEIVFGGTSGLSSYLSPDNGDIYVLLWYSIWFMLLSTASCWVIFLQGAEFLAKHPGLFRHAPRNPRVIRAAYGSVALLGAIAAVLAMVLR